MICALLTGVVRGLVAACAAGILFAVAEDFYGADYGLFGAAVVATAFMLLVNALDGGWRK